MSEESEERGQEAGGLRWFPFISAMFVTALIVSNIIAVKLVTLGGSTCSAVILFHGVHLQDILTEVYGYRRARQVIWTGFWAT
jgi:uncharacterized PurR-regulated membrane protein YhhQ (DUF165 family)